MPALAEPTLRILSLLEDSPAVVSGMTRTELAAALGEHTTATANRVASLVARGLVSLGPPNQVLLTARGLDVLNGGHQCRVCFCTDHDACEADGFGCHWVEADLCSECAPA